MNSHYALSAYRNANQTLPPLQVVVLLYNEVLVCLRSAAEAAEVGDYGAQFDLVCRAIEILRGLLATLDLERGGALAERLRDVYESNMLALMGTVAKPNAPDCLRRIGDGLRELRDAWRDVANQPVARSVGPVRR